MKTEKQLQEEIYALVKVNLVNRGRYNYLAHTLDNKIEDDEEIKIICSGKYNNNQLEILSTNKKILMVNSGIVPQRIEIRIENINSIELKTKGLMTELHIVNAGTEYIIENLTNYSEFINIVNKQRDKAHSVRTNNCEEQNITEKIEKIAKLYREGILTEEEFNSKKQELLRKI